MRVAIVTTSWPAPSGRPGDASGHFVRTEAEELERSGEEVVVVAPPAGGAFGWPGVAARLRENPARAVEVARWVVLARRRVRALAPARVVAHWATPCAWPIGIAARDARLDVVSHGGDVRLLARLPLALRDRVACAIAERATEWRFVSDALRHELCACLGAEARARVGRIAAVRAPSIEMGDLAGVRRHAADLRRGLGARSAAVCVGRLVESKRVDRAIEHVARSEAPGLLVVVGDGPERPRLERLARSLGVDVRFVGTVDRGVALAWIAAADVVLHASTAEGLSTVVREAEALGTPVVRI
jgi:glycosyltransferase involved in cell wall biosynthesis